jgi:hypothetical protein
MSEVKNKVGLGFNHAHLNQLVEANIEKAVLQWIELKLQKIIGDSSAKELYLTYSLLASKLSLDTALHYPEENDLGNYLKNHAATQLEMGRLYVLVHVLQAKPDAFSVPVMNIIQIADKEELITFLKYLVLLPNAAFFKPSAVEALRTNIAPVFDAIALNNPYPLLHFNQQEWNQMYLKAVFIQRPLEFIVGIDQMANRELARIISDYAHERWAASRSIEPYFWRPVTKFIDATLLRDMERLLKSADVTENKAGALCCFYSEVPEAKALLLHYPDIQQQIIENKISWDTLKK